MIGACLGLALASSPPLAAILAAVGVLVGHFAVDREAVAPKAFRPPSKEELLGRSSAAPRRKAAAAPPPRAKPKKISADDLLLVDALCPLFVEVARADAPPVQMEIRVIREFFEQRLQFNEIAMDAVRLKLKDAIEAPEQDIEFLTSRARTVVKPSIRVEVCAAFTTWAWSMGNCSAASRTCSSASSPCSI